MSHEQKFVDCLECRHFKPKSSTHPAICKRCGHGEFFDPKIEDRELSESELWSMFAKLRTDDE